MKQEAIKWKRTKDQFSGSSILFTISVNTHRKGIFIIPVIRPKKEYLSSWIGTLPILDYCCIFSTELACAHCLMYISQCLIPSQAHCATILGFLQACQIANSATLEWPINDIKHSTQEVGHLSGLSPQQKMSKYQHIAVTAETRFFWLC